MFGLPLTRSARGCVTAAALLAASLSFGDRPVAQGLPDHALDFDGVNDYVTMGTALGLGAESFTLEVWFKREGPGVGASTGTGGVTAIPLVTKGRGEAEGSNVDMNYFLGIDAATGVLVADFEDTATGGNHPVSGVTPVTPGRWQHAAATYDVSTNTWRLYLNGVLDQTLTLNAAFTPRADSIQHAAIGSALTSAGAAAGFFAGHIDEVRIWNVVRTDAEIASGMNVEIAADAGLLGRWGLDDATGTVAADSSGNNVHGTLTPAANPPVWVAGAPLQVVAGAHGFDFNGTTNYVTFGPASGLGATTFTIEAWIKREGTGVTTSTGTGGVTAIPILAKGRGEADGSNVDANYFMGLHGTTGVLVADYEEGAGQASPGLNHPVQGTTAIAADNAWHHVAATFDGTTWNLYVDGVLDANSVVGAGRLPRADSIQHAAIGSALTSNGTAAGFFNGVIDEARIWSDGPNARPGSKRHVETGDRRERVARAVGPRRTRAVREHLHRHGIRRPDRHGRRRHGDGGLEPGAGRTADQPRKRRTGRRGR